MIWFSDGAIGIDAFGTFLMLYVGTIAWFTWRIARRLRAQRIAEFALRERIARHIGRARRATPGD